MNKKSVDKFPLY